MSRTHHSPITRHTLALLCVALAVLSTPLALAQLGSSNADVRMEILPGAVYPNQRVNFVLRISDVDLTAAPEIPPVRGATLRADRNGRSTVNGKNYLTFLYVLIANEPGEVIISPFTLQTPNGEVRTQPFTFTVLDNKPLVDKKNQGKKAFVIPSVPSTPVYQRESFIAYLTVFFDPRVDPTSRPEFESKGYAVAMTRDDYRGQALIDGTTFNYISYPMEITPVEAGTLRIASPTAEMMAYEQGRSNSIFSTRQGIAFSADGNDATFEVKPLPKAPEGFSGAVGKYMMDVTLPKVPKTAGDPVEVELRVKGTGKEEFVSAPLLDDPEEHWKIYDMGESRTVAEDGTITFRKVLRPTKPTKQIPPFVFTYFDPSKESYVVLASDTEELPWNLANFPTADNTTSGTMTRTSPTIAAAKISFPSLESPQWTATSTPTIQLETINLVGGGLSALALLALFLTKRSSRKSINNEARKLLHTASQKSNPVELRLHALLTAHNLLDPEHDLQGDWQDLAQIHDRLSYAPEKLSKPNEDDTARIERLMPKALQDLRLREARLPASKTHLTTTTLVALCCAIGLQDAQAGDEELEKHLGDAKQAIALQDWSAAVDAFSAIHSTGNYSPETLLAEGASYANLQQPTRAKASLAQALALDFNTWNDVQRNLALIDNSSIHQEYTRQLALITFPKESLTAALLIAFWLIVLSLVARGFLQRRWIATIAIAISGVLFLLLGAATIYLHTLPDARSVAVLTTDDTLRDVPLESSAPGAPIGGGELATAVEKSGAFILLEQLSDPQNRGWVKAESIVPLTPTNTKVPVN